MSEPTAQFQLGREQGRDETRQQMTEIIDNLTDDLQSSRQDARQKGRKIRRLRAALQEAQVAIDGDQYAKASQQIGKALEDEPEEVEE